MRTYRAITASDANDVTALERAILPPEMVESPELYAHIISTSYSRGAYEHGRMIGCLVATLREGSPDIDKYIEPPDSIYIYFLGVMPSKHRVAMELLRSFFSLAYENRDTVSFHCRGSSYALLTQQRVMRGNYRIAQDEHLPDFYFAEFGVHEDAHHVVLTPADRPPWQMME